MVTRGKLALRLRAQSTDSNRLFRKETMFCQKIPQSKRFVEQLLRLDREIESVTPSWTSWSAIRGSVQRPHPSGGLLQAIMATLVSTLLSNSRGRPLRGPLRAGLECGHTPFGYICSLAYLRSRERCPRSRSTLSPSAFV
jgi:hypothetical protein